MAYTMRICTILPYSQWHVLLYSNTVIFNRIAIFSLLFQSFRSSASPKYSLRDLLPTVNVATLVGSMGIGLINPHHHSPSPATSPKEECRARWSKHYIKDTMLMNIHQTYFGIAESDSQISSSVLPYTQNCKLRIVLQFWEHLLYQIYKVVGVILFFFLCLL